MIHAGAFIVLALVAAYVGWIAVLRHFQERIVFQPPAGVPRQDVAARQVRYRADDGIDLFAYVVGEWTPGRTLLLAFHGNADIARWFVPWAADVADRTNACVVLPEYRGYDDLAGQPTYIGSARDARAALGYVRDTLGVPAEDLVYFGHSLGTAIAAELAAYAEPRALVLQSPFSSAREMARRMVVPGVVALWAFISRVHFDTLQRVARLSCPVWVSHGDRDLVVPMRMGREVYAAAANKGELLIVPGAGHNDVPELGGESYWTWLRDALAPRLTFPTDPVARAETPPAP